MGSVAGVPRALQDLRVLIAFTSPFAFGATLAGRLLVELAYLLAVGHVLRKGAVVEVMPHLIDLGLCE